MAKRLRLPLVTSYDEVIGNVEQFNLDLERHPELAQKLRQHRHWYYIPERDLFGPSKFIGYKDITFEKYDNGKGISGVETETILKNWFIILDPNSIEYSFLVDKLTDLFSTYGKELRKTFYLHVPNDFQFVHLSDEEKCIISSFSEHEVELWTQLSDKEFEEWLETVPGKGDLKIRQGIVKIRRLQRSVIDTLKKKYKGTCQICGISSLEEYGVDISEAHHIEYFSKSLNNHPKNIAILCPTHHRLVHALEATFDRNNKTFIGKGKAIPLKINRHL